MVFIKTVLSLLQQGLMEEGQGSYSRIAGAAIVSATLFWITYLVFKNGQLPDLGGPALFVSVGVGAHYGINQLKEVAAAIKGTPVVAPTETKDANR